MINTIKNLFHLLYKILLFILGLIILVSYIWFRFVRERLPKYIPFELSLFGFIILLYICFIYGFIVIYHLRYNIRNNPEENDTPQEISKLGYSFQYIKKLFIDILIKMFSFISKFLRDLDSNIKTNVIIKPYYDKFLLIFISLAEKFVIYFKFPYNIFIVTFDLIPRAIMLIVLLIDIYYFNCIFLTYKFIYISIIILMGKYIKYSLYFAREEYIKHLESIVPFVCAGVYDADNFEDDEFGCYNVRKIREFVKIQTHELVYTEKKEYFKYRVIYENIPLEDSLETEFRTIMNKTIFISTCLDEHEFFDNHYSKIRYIKIILYSLYFICWFGILVISIYLWIILFLIYAVMIPF